MKNKFASLALFIPAVVLAQSIYQPPAPPQVMFPTNPQISPSKAEKIERSASSLVGSVTSDAVSDAAIPIEEMLSANATPTDKLQHDLGAGVASGSAENALTNAK